MQKTVKLNTILILCVLNSWLNSIFWIRWLPIKPVCPINMFILVDSYGLYPKM